MIVRPAAAADFAPAALIAEACYRRDFAMLLEAEALATRDAAFFRDRFARQLDGLLVADEASAIVGFALTEETVLAMLFVAPGAQGRGIGAALLRAVEERGVIALECFAANDGARRFYEREGWRFDRAYTRTFLGCEHAFVSYVR